MRLLPNGCMRDVVDQVHLVDLIGLVHLVVLVDLVHLADSEDLGACNIAI